MNYITITAGQDTTVRKLLKKYEFSNRAIAEILDEGYFLNDKKTKKSKVLKSTDIVKIPVEEEEIDYEPIAGEIKIIYEDDHILVVDKDPNLTINSKNQTSLANYIAYYFKENDIRAKIRFVNRLDMNTSGLMVVAKNKYAQSFYQKEIEEDRFKKLYIAAVPGNLDIDRIIRVYLNYDEDTKRYDVSNEGNLAITYFKTRACSIDKKICFVMADIKTGKTHQIRSSLAYLGHPIIGDRLYGSDIDMDRFFLHAYYISFNQFLTGESLSFESNPDFSQLDNIL